MIWDSPYSPPGQKIKYTCTSGNWSLQHTVLVWRRRDRQWWLGRAGSVPSLRSLLGLGLRPSPVTYLVWSSELDRDHPQSGRWGITFATLKYASQPYCSLKNIQWNSLSSKYISSFFLFFPFSNSSYVSYISFQTQYRMSYFNTNHNMLQPEGIA